MFRNILMSLTLLALSAAPLFAQEGPYVPCVGCDEFTDVPYPEPGNWYNPDQSGSGFTLEFQNGILAGAHYSYDTEGEPEWALLTGPLVRSETPGVMWELEVEPQRFTGGNCMGCPYQAPNVPEKLPAIKIEFLQRAYARLTLSDGSIQYIVPFMYGSSGKAFFAEQTPYLFPILTHDPWPGLWTLVFKRFSEEEYAPWLWSSTVLIITEGSIDTGGNYEGMLRYGINLPLGPPEELVVGSILCGLDETLGEPGCMLHLGSLGFPDFQISIGNFTDSRFFGESEEGDTVTGFRLQYD